MAVRDRQNQAGALAAALAVIVTADMVPVNLRYLGRERFVPESAVRIRPTEADLQILADTVGEPGYRVLNLTVSRSTMRRLRIFTARWAGTTGRSCIATKT